MKVSDVKVGDMLALDLYHMQEEPHKVLEVSASTDLFGNEVVSFYVKCLGQRFWTFDMYPEQTVSTYK